MFFEILFSYYMLITLRHCQRLMLPRSAAAAAAYDSACQLSLFFADAPYAFSIIFSCRHAFFRRLLLFRCFFSRFSLEAEFYVYLVHVFIELRLFYAIIFAIVFA